MKRRHQSLALLASLAWLSSPACAVQEASFGDYADTCPGSCSKLGADPAKWTQYHRLSDLALCDEPVLFDLNVQNLVSDPSTQITLRACSRADEQTLSTNDTALASNSHGPISVANSCGAAVKSVKVTASVSSGVSDSSASSADLSAAVDQLAFYLQQGASCGSTILFAKSGDAVVGLYAGAEIQKTTADGLISSFRQQLTKPTGSLSFQVCGANGVNATAAQTFGLYAGIIADLATAQDAVRTWANNKCLGTQGTSQSVGDLELGFLVSAAAADATNNSTSASNSTIAARKHHIEARDYCRDIQVNSGDSCASLATSCGISGSDFTKYNPGSTFCSTLKPKQWVCCSAGTLQDHSPQPSSDGSCYTYTVQNNDGCFAIGDAFGINQTVIENNNKNTWGWAGCARLQPGQVICLSRGDPPFPNAIEGASCGPQVPGTVKPTDGTAFADLNPCPLNACCDVWGYCGTTDEFCTKTPADTGAPGTAQPNTNGCISNCGTNITNNGSPPGSFRSVGYFESWNWNRKCLNMDSSQIDASKYSTVHFAFATLTEDWQVQIDPGSLDQFNKFRALGGDVHKVISFGGWAFSTDAATFQRFRDATQPANRAAFAANAVQFMKDQGCDGLDFDWEYPGAPDIPGVPAGSKDEASNYLKFLALLKPQMPSGTTVSIALPASYWYLKQYPVKQMQTYVDYFVYMTYDFHGQWDYDNKYSTPGCPTGNCVRSHVNISETTNSLAMITKAGVQANKLAVGVSSYGRSFRLADPNCTGFMCQYTGTANSSDAYKGRCTDTAGYISDAEIQEIIDGKAGYSVVKTSYDAASDSNILVYGNGDKLDWVGYMDSTTKQSRAGWISKLNMGGSTDWAVDLETFLPAVSDPGSDNPDPDDKCEDKKTYSDAPMPAGDYMPWYLMDPEDAADTGLQYITIVNLTPHLFKLDHTHSYQMDTFDWGDIPPGRSRQNIASYGGGTPVDTNGEAYYKIDGTDKLFVIRATTHIPDTYPRRTVIDLTGMGQGQREYQDPGQAVPVTLVITGSNDYREGFITSLSHGPGGWMRRIYDSIGDRSIQHLIMGGTHDSGMSTISGKITTGFGTVANSQTQGLNFYDQLRTGARWFDLRIASIHDIISHNYDFYATHVNDEMADVSVGNTGEALNDIISEINHFTDENPGEVIFVRLKYLVGIRSTPSLGPIMWGDDIINDFYSRLRTVKRRCPNLDTNTNFMDQPASYFMSKNGNEGCVIFLLSGHLDKSKESMGDGIYNDNRAEFWDDWAQKDDTQPMAEKEMADWGSIGRSGSFDNAYFHIAQWLVTVDPLTSYQYGLELLAILPTNPALFWKGVNNMSPTSWPNVLMVDYIGVVVQNQHDWDQLSAELYTLIIGLNLYMIGENCDVNKKRSLVYPAPKTNGALSKVADATAANAGSQHSGKWNGIIFANGTKIDNPPPATHPGRVEIFKAGTRFSNGTVLQYDVPNPDFSSTKV